MGFILCPNDEANWGARGRQLAQNQGNLVMISPWRQGSRAQHAKM